MRDVISSNVVKRPSLLVQSFIIFVTLTAVAVSVFNGNKLYNDYRAICLDQFNKHQLVIARSVASGIETYFNEVRNILKSTAGEPAVQRIMPECFEWMRRMYNGIPLKSSIRLLDEKGVLRLIYPYEGWREKILGQGYNGRNYFQKAKNAGKIVSAVVTNEQGNKRIRIAAPLYWDHDGNDRKSTFNGVLVVSFDLNEIARTFISSIVSGETGYAWLIDNDGIFLAHHDVDFVGRNAFMVRKEKVPHFDYEPINRIQRAMLAGREGTDCYVSGWHRERAGRIEKLIAYSPIRFDDYFWSLAVCAPVEEVDWIMRAAGKNMLYVLAFVVFIIIVAGFSLFVTVYRWSQLLERKVDCRTKELGESEERNRSLIDVLNSSEVGTCVLDSDQRVVWMNESMGNLFGLRKEEGVGKDLRQIIQGKIKIIFENQENFVKKVFDTHEENTYQEAFEFHVLADGERKDRWLEYRSQPIKTGLYAGGRIEHYCDITKQKKLREIFRQEKEFSESIIDTAQAIMLLLDTEGRILRFNSYAEEITGYRLKEVVGRDWFSIFLPSHDRDRMRKTFKKAVSDTQTQGNVDPILTKDGHIRHIEWYDKTLKDNDGNIIGLLIIGHDITKRRHAEKKLAENEDFSRNLLNNLRVGVSIIKNDRIVYQNPESKRLLGSLPESFTFSYFDYIHPDDVEMIRENYRKILLEEKTSLDVNFRCYPFGEEVSDGNMKWVQGLAVLIKHEGEKVILLNMLDITRAKELEQIINVEDKMSSLGRVATGIAHEIRNPLSTVNVYLSALRKKVSTIEGMKEERSDDIHDIIKEIENSSHKIESVIRRVMDFSKPNELKLALEDIDHCIDTAIKLSAVTLRKSGIAVKVTSQDRLPLCYIDKQYIVQVMLNLITNAAEAMEEMAGQKQIGISTSSDNNWITIVVFDSGPGVRQGVRDKIFDPFYSSKDSGSGIGLSICHRIVKDHSGSMGVSTSKWGGAEFVIKLPVDLRTKRK